MAIVGCASDEDIVSAVAVEIGSRADLLLHHESGAAVLWQMSGSQILDSVTLADGLSQAWQML